MALAIHISTYISGGYTGNLIRWRLVEVNSGILNDIHEEPGPHGETYNFSFTSNILDIVYRIELYSVPPLATVGNLIKSWNVTPSTQTLILDADIEVIVDGSEDYDPASGQPVCTIDALIGKEISLHQRGIGQLLFVRSSEYEFDNTTGDITLIGANFSHGDVYIVKIKAQLVVNPPGTQQVTSIYKDVVLKTADFSIISSDLGKKFIINAPIPVVTVTFDSISMLHEKIPVFFESVGENHINVILRAATGEKIQTYVSEQTMILGKSEKAEAIRLGDVLYGFSDSIDIKKAGQLEWGYYLSANRVWADGSEYLCADYPRLKKAIDKMPSGLVKTYTQWAATATVNGVTNVPINKGFFAISNDGLNFKVPDLRNKTIRALKNNGGTDTERVANIAGGYQDGMIKAHSHRVNTTGNQSGVDPGLALQRSSMNGDGYDTSGTGLGSLGPYIESVGGIETRVENIGLIPMIII